MSLTVKDVFFVHSKRAPWECTLVEKASHQLSRCGFHVWNYEDWDWEHETQDIKYSQSGIHLDMKRFLAGDPKPFRKVVRDEEVDMEELERIFKGTKVVVVLNPTGWPIGGVEDEIQALKWMGTRILGHRYVLCRRMGTETHRVVGGIDYSETVELPMRDESTDDDAMKVAVVITRQVLDGTVERHLDDHECEIVGWHLPTDIARSRLVLERLQQTGVGACPSFAALQHAISKAEEVAGRQS